MHYPQNGTYLKTRTPVMAVLMMTPSSSSSSSSASTTHVGNKQAGQNSVRTEWVSEHVHRGLYSVPLMGMELFLTSG